MGTTTLNTIVCAVCKKASEHAARGLCRPCYSAMWERDEHSDYTKEDTAQEHACRRARLRVLRRQEAVARHAGPFITGARVTA